MNFEHLCKYILNNKKRLTPAHAKKIKITLSYFYTTVILNRQKLKLGKVVFLINTFDARTPLKNPVTLKFANQDSANSTDQQIQILYDEFSWKWTKTHVASLILVFFFCSLTIWKNIRAWVLFNLPFLFYNNTLLESLVRLSLTQLFNLVIITPPSFVAINTLYVDLIYEFCLFYNIIV